MTKLELQKIIPISSKSAHSAFTDLVLHAGNLVACYRQASNHVSKDGTIETVVISTSGQIRCRQRLCIKSTDLRDPKISVQANGKLLLIAYARRTDSQNKTLSSQSICWVSEKGETWSSSRYFGPKSWWLWRLRWHQNKAYGLAYNRAANRVDLYAGYPGGAIECIKQGALSLAKHGKGYPNESDIWFDRMGVMHALVRRDADTFSAMWGRATFPYTRWHWTDLKTYIGGPVVLTNGDDTVLISGRCFEKNKLRTAIWAFNPCTCSLNKLITLPSAGDNSYPGMAKQGNTLYVVYYSMHIDNESRVYLATLNVNES